MPRPFQPLPALPALPALHHHCHESTHESYYRQYRHLLEFEYREYNRLVTNLQTLRADLNKLNTDILALRIDNTFSPEDFSVNIPAFPRYTLFDWAVIAVYQHHDRFAEIHLMQRKYDDAIVINMRIRSEIGQFEEKKRRLEKNLGECQTEFQRCENYKKHVGLLEGKPRTADINPIKPPISRFKNSEYQGIPVRDGFSYPALCLINNNDGFVYAVNKLQYPLMLENVPVEKQAIEILRKKPNVMDLLTLMSLRITASEFAFFIQQSINDASISFENYRALQYLLENKHAFDEKIESSLAAWACNQLDFSLFLSVFKHRQVYFSPDARNKFLASGQALFIDDLYALYTYKSQFQIQDASVDIGFTNPEVFYALIVKAAEKKTLPNPLDSQLLTFLMENNVVCFNSILKHQPELITTWFNSSEISFHQKYCLIYRAPNLFSLAEVESVFERLSNYPETTLMDDYYHFFSQLNGLEQNKKEMYALALFKSRINQEGFQQNPQDIINFALHLEKQWTQEGYSPKSIELMLKFAKNQLLNMVSQKVSLCDDANIEQFMAKHRIKRTLFGIIPIPSTLWWTPSTIMFYKFKRQKHHEVEAAVHRLSEEQRNTHQTFTSCFSR